MSEKNSGKFRFWHDERRFKGGIEKCLVQQSLYAAGESGTLGTHSKQQENLFRMVPYVPQSRMVTVLQLCQPLYSQTVVLAAAGGFLTCAGL